MKNKLITFIFFLLIPTLLISQNNISDSLQIERLAALGKLWGKIRYFHPYLAYKKINWDSALVQAITKVYKSKNKNEYASVVQSMLDALQDPLTKVEVTKTTKSDTSKIEPVSFTWDEDSILIVSATDYRVLENFVLMRQKLREASCQILKARGVLFDLRNLKPSKENTQGYFDYWFASSGIQKYLSAKSMMLPSFRSRLHSGFKPETGGRSGGYYSSFDVQDCDVIKPVNGAKDIPIIFIINSKSDLPLIAWSLQLNGLARIFWVGDGDFFLPGNSVKAELSDNLFATIRIDEMISPSGNLDFKPDKTLSPEIDIKSIATNEISNFSHVEESRSAIKFRLGTYIQNSFPENEDFPSKEYRLLAAFKIWTVFNYFFPYKDLMNEDWDNILKLSITKFENASNAQEYRDAVSEMIAYTHDSHAWVNWPSKDRAFPMFVCRYIENKLIVTRVFSDSLNNTIMPGDEIVSIDRESISNLEKIHRTKISASTEQSMKNRLARSFFYGKDSSEITIVIKTKNNKIKKVKTTRTNAFWQEYRKGYRGGDIRRLISPEIGYADLDRLQVTQVDSMFAMFKNTKAIIFDMRGYPNGTVWHIAPRLNKKGSKIYGALFEKPLLSSDELSDDYKFDLSYTFFQPVPETDKPAYTGKTVVLIDERAISQSEHTCLFFESVTDVTFIGSPTAGANGDVTRFYIPGNISIGLTGQSVRHADGRQLQRIGILPDIEITPTIEGIRYGKDEVLERAIEFVKTGK